MRFNTWNGRLGRSATAVVALLAVAATTAQAQDPEAGDTRPVRRIDDDRDRIDADDASPRPRRYRRDDPSELPPRAYRARGGESGDYEDSDHDAFVGRFGVGFFGVLTLPIAACGIGPVCAFAADTLPAPTIGARYWLQEDMGVEGAVGLMFRSRSLPGLDISEFGFALHGGLPLVFADTGHFAFQVIPQLNIGLATGSYETLGMVPTTVDVSGLLFEIGARVGAEIHFGFIDIPQLSLQGTLGLMIRHESVSAEPSGGVAEVSQSVTTIATLVDAPPWAIFTGGLTAIYYY
jgi:hypothetical protein